MNGVVYINAEAGRALRARPATLTAACVLDCSGAFRSGDRVYVVVRGKDGGQIVLAIGTVRCDAQVLRSSAMRSPSRPGSPDPFVVIEGRDLEPIWSH